jgi:hypothetical protein
VLDNNRHHSIPLIDLHIKIAMHRQQLLTTAQHSLI